LISDEGSSYWFGWNAIRLAAGACDGRWQTALLHAGAAPAWDRRHVADLHQRLYSQGITKAEIAAFAPLVIEAAAAGDALASWC
jgi:N-acetylglucosamine kinase-like BadF-type ATPase